MDAKQERNALVAAIIAGVLSLPTTWITIHNAQPIFNFGSPMNGFGGMFHSPFGGMNFDLTAFNGSVTFLIKTPLWFVVLVAISASVLQLMRRSNSFAIPPFALWSTALVGVIWTALPIGGIVLSGKASPGVGWLLGLASAVTPLVCLILSKQDFRTSSIPHQSETPESPSVFELPGD